MKLQGTMKINDSGHLEIGGCDATVLRETYGTPLVVVDEGYLQNICRDYYQAFSKKENDMVIYASKAFLTPALLGIIKREGLGLDTVSGGEL